jgi:hypothetical protein
MGVAAVTVRLAVVDFCISPPLAVMISGYVPMGVEELVLTASEVEQFGVQGVFESEAVAP